ncbi:MAG: DUF402 domain-containing protein [Chloroflexota bacterium]|nr:DUF402 domain-containing protein [Chloroflexota bacterium]
MPGGAASGPRDGEAGKAPSWPHLPVGTPLTVVKLAPDGREAARYPGTVVEAGAPSPWLGVAAVWRNRRVEIDGLVFEPGDTLHELFSPTNRFNAFAVFAPDGRLRGWYGNVSHLPTLDLDADPPVLAWHDLFLDVVLLPDGALAVLDEDELAAARLNVLDPSLHAVILAARDALLDRARRRDVPFHQSAPRPGADRPR